MCYLSKHGVLKNGAPQLEHIMQVSFLRLCAEQTLLFLMASLFFSFFFIHVVDHKPLHEFQVHSVDCVLDPSPEVICMAFVSLLMLRLAVCALSFYHSRLIP